MLGLGDIVLPGVFCALCLRYDVIRSLNSREVNRLMEAKEGDKVVKMMVKASEHAPKTYFYGSMVGYLIAILATVVIMVFFDHG